MENLATSAASSSSRRHRAHLELDARLLHAFEVGGAETSRGQTAPGGAAELFLRGRGGGEIAGERDGGFGQEDAREMIHAAFPAHAGERATRVGRVRGCLRRCGGGVCGGEGAPFDGFAVRGAGGFWFLIRCWETGRGEGKSLRFVGALAGLVDVLLQQPANRGESEGEETEDDGGVLEEALQLVPGFGVAVDAEVRAVEGAAVEQRPAAVHDRGVAGALQTAGEDAEVGDGAEAGETFAPGAGGAALRGRRVDGAQGPGPHGFGDERQRGVLEQRHHRRQRPARRRRLQLVRRHHHFPRPHPQRVSDVRHQRETQQVRWRALDPVLRNHNRPRALRRRVVLLHHLVHPGYFARDVQVVRARLGARRQHRRPVFDVRPHGRDEHFGLLGEPHQVGFLQLRGLDPRGRSVRVERLQLRDQLLQLGFVASGHRPPKVRRQVAGGMRILPVRVMKLDNDSMRTPCRRQ
nr:hypothetical protein CFP56_54476 [Quercus suber]